MRLANVEVDLFKVAVQQYSDSSYKVMANVKNLLFDDLRPKDEAGIVVHMIDRHSIVDPNAYLFTVSLEFKPKTDEFSTAQRIGKYIRYILINSTLGLLI